MEVIRSIGRTFQNELKLHIQLYLNDGKERFRVMKLLVSVDSDLVYIGNQSSRNPCPSVPTIVQLGGYFGIQRGTLLKRLAISPHACFAENSALCKFLGPASESQEDS